MTDTPSAVSVVTPVYNGGHYISECIESVLRQTHEDFQYVIADNASTDDTVAIAQRYESQDSRVRVVAFDEHLSNHIANWNRALSLVHAGARYVKVVHADDWLFDECIARMVEHAERHPSVGLVGSYRLDESRVTLDGLPPSTTVLPGAEVARSFLLGGPYPFLFGSPTSLLVRADVITAHDRFYDEDVLHADNDACMRALAMSDFGFVHQVLTYTRRHNEAVTAFTKRVGTPIPNNLDLFQRWGPTFLTEDEYERKLVVRLVDYAAFIATNPRKWLQHEFRDYHRERLGLILGRTTPGEITRGLRLQLGRTAARRVPGAAVRRDRSA
jgi:glycosyltransferase involved in cell wall biosynthesis